MSECVCERMSDIQAHTGREKKRERVVDASYLSLMNSSHHLYLIVLRISSLLFTSFNLYFTLHSFIFHSFLSPQSYFLCTFWH